MQQDAMSRRGTMRAELRAQTHEIHQNLHLHSHFVALFDGSLDKPEYVSLLRRFYGFYKPMEAAIRKAIRQSPDIPAGFSYVERTPMLEQDLADLGCDKEDIAQIPCCLQIAQAVTPVTLGGVLYVIEGSTLGAALIDRAARNILHENTTSGRAFWAWSRAHNKQRWAMANVFLDHLDLSGHPQDAVVRGAQDTFAALANWLAPLDDPARRSEGVPW